jgi:hypothetical protein
MFIHWGPFSVGAGAEWLMNRNAFSRTNMGNGSSTVSLPKNLIPKLESSRHHDGFCQWDADAQSDWKATVYIHFSLRIIT